MNVPSKTSLIAGLGLLGAFSTPAATVLLFDDFENGDIANGGPGTVNAGFTLVNNSSGGAGSVSESGGHMVTASEFQDSGGDNSGGVSKSFDVTQGGSPGMALLVTWTIDSLGNFDANSNDRVLLDLTGTPHFRGFPNAGSGNSADEDHIALDIRGDGSVFLRSDPEINTSINTITTLSELTDGFTVVGAFNSLGWSYTFSGVTMDNGPTVLGAWGTSGTLGSYPATFDNETYVNVTNRRSTANVESIRVEIIPEPSSTLLFGCAALTLLGIRRRPS